MMTESTPSSQPNTEPDAASPAPKPKKAKKVLYSFLFRWSHWVLGISAFVLIVSGYSLYAGSRPDWTNLFGGKVVSWLWTGRVSYWHAWAALFFTPAIVAASVSYLRKRIVYGRTQVLLLVAGLLLLLTGFVMGNPVGAGVLYSGSVWIHSIVGLLVLPAWLIWHIYMGLTGNNKMLPHVIRPWAGMRLAPIGVLALLGIIGCVLLLNGWPLQSPSWRNLTAGRIVEQDEEVSLASLPWDDASPLEVPLTNGSSMDKGNTLCVLQAMHDGKNLYVKAVWADDDENYEYWPWRKTDDGWEYTQTSTNDEITTYEDKFSMVFPIEPSGDFERFGCATTCHLDAEYGWGYKGTSEPLDVWHWKAARTGSVGQIDDKYWDVADFDNKDIGRHGDPKDGGGYTKNYDKEIPHPLFLPDSTAAVYHGAFPKANAVEYTEEAGAAIPVGTLVPGVVTDPYLGDRGNVRCESSHADGHWTLLISRPLATGSEFDAQFVPGESVAFGCAAFDHAGKRHAYNLSTFHLVLED